MTEEHKDDCFICKFYLPDTTMNGEFGACRRFPPVLDASSLVLRSDSKVFDQIESAGEYSGFWTHPRVSNEDWCGEFVKVSEK